MLTESKLPPVATVRPAIAAIFNLPADQLYDVIETEFVFPGDFAILKHGESRRFALITETGAQIETGHLSPAEYQILAWAIPLEPRTPSAAPVA